MSVFKALEMEEQKEEKGWSHSNMFSNTTPITESEGSVSGWSPQTGGSEQEVSSSVVSHDINTQSEATSRTQQPEQSLSPVYHPQQGIASSGNIVNQSPALTLVMANGKLYTSDGRQIDISNILTQYQNSQSSNTSVYDTGQKTMEMNADHINGTTATPQTVQQTVVNVAVPSQVVLQNAIITSSPVQCGQTSVIHSHNHNGVSQSLGAQSAASSNQTIGKSPQKLVLSPQNSATVKKQLALINSKTVLQSDSQSFPSSSSGVNSPVINRTSVKSPAIQVLRSKVTKTGGRPSKNVNIAKKPSSVGVRSTKQDYYNLKNNTVIKQIGLNESAANTSVQVIYPEVEGPSVQYKISNINPQVLQQSVLQTQPTQAAVLLSPATTASASPVQGNNKYMFASLSKKNNQVFSKYVGSTNASISENKGQENIATCTLLKSGALISPVKQLTVHKEVSQHYTSTVQPSHRIGSSVITNLSNLTQQTQIQSAQMSSDQTLSGQALGAQSANSKEATVLCSYSNPTINIPLSEIQASPQIEVVPQETTCSQNSVISIDSSQEVEMASVDSISTAEENSNQGLTSISPGLIQVLNNREWQKDMVYYVPDENKDFYLIYDGEKLCEYSPAPDFAAVKSGACQKIIVKQQNCTSLKGGGPEKKPIDGATDQSKEIQDNQQINKVKDLLMKSMPPAKGTHVVTVNNNSVTSTPNVQNGRIWKHSGGPQGNLVRRSVHAVPSQNKNETKAEPEEEKSGENVANKGNTDTPKRRLQPTKRPLNENSDEECIVHCRYCGYSSSNIKECDRCGRIFAANVKVDKIKRKKTTTVKGADKGTSIDKQSFYGQKLKEQSAPYTEGVTEVLFKYVKEKQGYGRKVTVAGKTHRTPRVTKVAPEPVTVILSSDDEEETSQPVTQPATSVSDSKTSTSGTVVTISMSSVGSAVSNNTDDDLSDLVNFLPNKRNTSPTFTRSRVQKMENQEGKVVTTDKKKPPSRPPSRAENSESDTLPEDPIPASVRGQQLENLSGQSSLIVKAKTIHIGSLKGIPIDPVMFSSCGVHIYIECEEDTWRIEVRPEEMEQYCIFFGSDKVIMMKTTAEFGKRMRLKLGMEQKVDGKPYFDPDSNDVKYQFISIYISDMGVSSTQLNNFLQKYSQGKLKTKTDFVYEMDENEYRSLKEQVVESASGEITPAVNDKERSPSPPRILFCGPVIKLITFPPPPEKGGIQVTNEDLFCLQDGEFLNDVIIDFYLKYLFFNVLSPEDRKRTHIFSSFFFKRLTLRQGRGNSANETPDMTPAEKKHARVRTWTKHVDLFEKDFIIVPINEHSHWFLAIICFPGMNGVQRSKYIPRPRPAIEAATPVKEQKDGIKQLPALAVHSASIVNVKLEPYKSLKTYKIPKKGEKAEEKQDKQSAKEGVQETEQDMELDEKKVEMENESRDDNKDNIEDEACEPGEQKNEETAEEPMDTEENGMKNQQTETENVNKTVTASTIRNYKEICGRPLTKEEQLNQDLKLKVFEGQKQPCILVLDSLAGQSRGRISNTLKEYLQIEWDVKKKTPNNLKEKIRGSTPKVPQQTNFSDCGVYVLQYVESFFEDPIQDFSIPMKSLGNWFSSEKVSKKRVEIENIVMQLKKEADEKATGVS